MPPGYPGRENLWAVAFRLTVGEKIWNFDFFRCSFGNVRDPFMKKQQNKEIPLNKKVP